MMVMTAKVNLKKILIYQALSRRFFVTRSSVNLSCVKKSTN